MIQTKEATTFEKYPEYKDSGSYWSGQIPEEWNALPIRAIFEERNEKNDGPKTDFILSVTKDRGVIPYDEKGAVGNNKSEEIERYKLVYPNDFVINKMNVVIGSLGMSKYFGAFSQVYLVYKPKTSQINIEYYSYIFSNPTFYKSLIKFCTGIMELRESLNKSDFKKIILPFPSFETQTSIVNFLDDKTSKIDTAIAQKEQMIALLKERKQIVIQNAVTGKWSMVDGKWAETPKEKMKDSGVEWLGEIPEGWDTVKLKFIIESRTGNAFPSIMFTLPDSDGIPVVRISDLDFDGIVKLDKCPKLPWKFSYDIESYGLRKGDILFAMTGGTIGKVAQFTGDDTALLNQRVCSFRIDDETTRRFILHWVNTSIWREYINLNSSGGAQPNISDVDVLNLRITFPPLSEQTTIATFLDNKTSKIDRAISLQQSQIEKLKEYKATLIDSAVTGKIKVTDE